MTRTKLSDTATSADWTFLELDGMTEALRSKAEYVAGKYRLEADDLCQEATLALAVRPNKTTDTNDVDLIAFRGYQFMLDRAEPEVKRRKREESFEFLLEGEAAWPA